MAQIGRRPLTPTTAHGSELLKDLPWGRLPIGRDSSGGWARDQSVFGHSIQLHEGVKMDGVKSSGVTSSWLPTGGACFGKAISKAV